MAQVRIRAFQPLRAVMRDHLPQLRAAGAFGLAEALVALAEPWPLKIAIDYGIGGRSLPAGLRFLEPLPGLGIVAAAGAATVALTGLLGWLGYRTAVCSETAAEQIGGKLRLRVFDHATAASLRFHDRVRSGELSSRLMSDVDRVLDALTTWFTSLLPDAVLLSGMIVVLAMIDPGLMGAALAVVPLLWVMAVRKRRQIRAAEARAREARGRLAETTTDLFRNVRAIQAFGKTGLVEEVFRRRNAEAVSGRIESITLQARWSPLTDLLLAAGSAGVLTAGSIAVIGQRLTVGTLLVVLGYVAMMYSPVRSLTRLSTTLAKAAVSAARLDEVLSCEGLTPVAGTRPAPQVRSAIELRHVGFGYVGEMPVLDDITLSVAAGEMVAVVGPSGVGKSTLCLLLLRLYDPDSGSIEIDGIDLREVEPSALRRRIGFVPQEAWMLDGTIAENIAVGRPGLLWSDVLVAGHRALVDRFVHDLPDGYHSPVGESGGRLSGGERRRVAIARAIAADVRLLLLDEPTAGLDSAAKQEVIAAIGRAAVGRTVLLVTHDPDLAATADRIVVLENGRIAPSTMPPGSRRRTRSPFLPPLPLPPTPRKEVNHVQGTQPYPYLEDPDAQARTPQPVA